MERRSEALSLIEDKDRQLERCGRDSDKTKLAQAAAAAVSSAEVEALKKKLSDKGEEVCHLSSELSQLKQELRLMVSGMQSEKDAHKETEEVYQSNLVEFHLKIQELEREAKEATRLRRQLEDALEEEIDLGQHNHGFGGECTKHIPVPSAPDIN